LGKMLAEDPVKAWRYMNEQAFGIPNPHEVFKMSLQAQAQQARAFQAMQFLNQHQDFPKDPQSINVLNQIMSEGQLPNTLQGMEAAYSVALVRGLIKPNSGQQQQQMQQNPAPSPRPNPQQGQWFTGFQSQEPAAPPRLGRSAADSLDENELLERFENLPASEMRKFLEKLGS
jgi:hypothetical protein